ncbi:MAG: hypothetical protein P1Q69_02870 [Candidatus Thorarchaeota archaeon]|nr:hypothetical protein [Candidatus Thorarchaeota archaeon]
MTKSILIAASPLTEDSDGNPLGERGSILAHACHLAKHGGVVWVLIQPGESYSEAFRHPDLKRAYFYDVPSQTISYRATIDFAGAPGEIPNLDTLKWYYPQFRPFPPAEFTFILLISGFERLDKNYRLDDFFKLDGSKVERVQNYVLIEDPEFTSIYSIPK